MCVQNRLVARLPKSVTTLHGLKQIQMIYPIDRQLLQARSKQWKWSRFLGRILSE